VGQLNDKSFKEHIQYDKQINELKMTIEVREKTIADKEFTIVEERENSKAKIDTLSDQFEKDKEELARQIQQLQDEKREQQDVKY